jgi:periplasmic protein TonB
MRRKTSVGSWRTSLIFLGFAACVSPVPPAPLPRDPPPPDFATTPHYTAYTRAPQILNRDEIVAAMIGAYPPELRDSGRGGTVRIYFLIDEAGTVLNRIIDESSGYPTLDAAAMRVASVYRFGPAMNGEEPVYAWVSFPMTFEVR